MLNNCVFIGRLTKDPELQTVGAKQVSKVRFTLAVNRPKYGDAEPQADFIPVTAWRGTAEFVSRNFHKGQQVYATGRLQTYSWEDDEGKHYGFEIVANEVGFADAPKKGGQAKSKSKSAAPDSGGFSDDVFGDANGFSDDFNGFDDFCDGSEDDLPF
jgi:single-strand DNA-binding protein